jgi:hypothetical protein
VTTGGPMRWWRRNRAVSLMALLRVELGRVGVAFVTTEAIAIGADAGQAAQITRDSPSALKSAHLLDALSSDRHTVKPWVQWQAGLRAGLSAVLLYHRRQHIINVFTWPSAATNGGPKHCVRAWHPACPPQVQR